MRNLMRLTYAANKAQAWEDWNALEQQARLDGHAEIAERLRPYHWASMKKIDEQIAALRDALKAADA